MTSVALPTPGAPCYLRRMRLQRAAWGLVVFVLADAACFDSDQTFKSAATTTGTTGTTTTTTAETTTTGTTTTSAETGPFDTCRDAIQCVFQCAGSIQAQLQQNPDFEPDLSCFIECAETLSVDEVYKLFNLINCTGQVCKDIGECVDSSTTSSGESSSSSSTSGDTSSTSSSSSESSSSSSSSEGGEDGGLIDPCINCIFTRMLDPESPGCEEFAMMCE